METFVRSLVLVALAAGSMASAQAPSRKIRPYQGPVGTVHLDAGTGVITRGAAVRSRAAATVSDFPNLDTVFVGADSGGGSTEWFADGVKGVSGNASDLMTSFVVPYCSAMLDTSLGGPGGTVKLGFYEGYTRNGDGSGAPNGTLVTEMTLTGLPAHTAASSFHGSFSCYFLQVDFASLVPFADGPIGYSWHFLDTGTDGVLAGTFPFLASTGSCSGTVPVPGDPLGQDAYTCCSFAPADVYRPPGQLHVVLTFAPYCIPYAMAIDIREVADLAASATAFHGDGVNVDTLSASPAIVGQSWSAQVALHHPHGTSGAVELSIRTTSINGPTMISPIGGRPYELLVSGPLLGRLVVAHDGTTSTPIALQIPARIGLVGRAWAAQALVVGGGFADLSSSVFGVTGTE